MDSARKENYQMTKVPNKHFNRQELVVSLCRCAVVPLCRCAVVSLCRGTVGKVLGFMRRDSFLLVSHIINILLIHKTKGRFKTVIFNEKRSGPFHDMMQSHNSFDS